MPVNGSYYKEVFALETCNCAQGLLHSLLLQINFMYIAGYRANSLLMIVVLVFISSAQQYLTEISYTCGDVQTEWHHDSMFFCTVAFTLIRVADKTDKAAETLAVTC